MGHHALPLRFIKLQNSCSPHTNFIHLCQLLLCAKLSCKSPKIQAPHIYLLTLVLRPNTSTARLTIIDGPLMHDRINSAPPSFSQPSSSPTSYTICFGSLNKPLQPHSWYDIWPTPITTPGLEGGAVLVSLSVRVEREMCECEWGEARQGLKVHDGWMDDMHDSGSYLDGSTERQTRRKSTWTRHGSVPVPFYTRCRSK